MDKWLDAAMAALIGMTVLMGGVGIVALALVVTARTC